MCYLLYYVARWHLKAGKLRRYRRETVSVAAYFSRLLLPLYAVPSVVV